MAQIRRLRVPDAMLRAYTPLQIADVVKGEGLDDGAHLLLKGLILVASHDYVDM